VVPTYTLISRNTKHGISLYTVLTSCVSFCLTSNIHSRFLASRTQTNNQSHISRSSHSTSVQTLKNTSLQHIDGVTNWLNTENPVKTLRNTSFNYRNLT